MSTPVRQDPTAWRQGFEAGRSGLPDRCPHPPISPLAWAWESGFIEGRADREKAARRV